jgi:glycosyltransferase involved in cell wall biosynthesis
MNNAQGGISEIHSLTILVPIYNEERTISELVNRLLSIPKNIIYECIFVLDGCTDGSERILRKSLENVSFTFRIFSKKNGGKTSAVHFGSKLVNSSHVLILDSDLELDPIDAINLWEVVTSGKSNFVFGFRTFRSQSSFTYRYSVGNKLISNLYGILFNSVITDIMCGYKLVPTDTLKSIPNKHGKFSLEIMIPILMYRQGFKPFEIPVNYYPRTRAEGKSITKINAIRIIVSLVYLRIFKLK